MVGVNGISKKTNHIQKWIFKISLMSR